MYNSNLEVIDSLWKNQNKMVSLPPLNTIHTLGSDCGGQRICHTCRGERMVAIRAKWDNRLSYKQCPACFGSGSIDSRLSK